VRGPCFLSRLPLENYVLDAERDVKKGELYLVINSTSSKDADEVIELKKKIGKNVYSFVGLHPNSDQSDIEQTIQTIQSKADIIDGIGEIGLDERNDTVNRNFELQLEIAERLKKPVNVHSRGKTEKVIETLGSYQLNGVMLHWFSGNDAELAKACDRGYLIGFGPASVYSKKLQKLIAKCPLQNLMTESDAPVRYSACFEEMETDPRFVASVIFSLSIHKKLDAEDMEKAIERNFRNYIGLKLRIHQ